MVLDERGREATSEGLAELLAKVKLHAAHALLHTAACGPQEALAKLLSTRNLSSISTATKHSDLAVMPGRLGHTPYRSHVMPG